MQTYFAPGKILLAGEYTVLLGLEAMALPVKDGQWLEFFEYKTPEGQSDMLRFQALDEKGAVWLQFAYDLNTMQAHAEQNSESAAFESVLQRVPPDFWKPNTSYRLETRLEFGRNTGLGSSSTFISLMSQCFHLDPQKLQKDIFNGSGYDVAIATLGKPLTFWRKDGEAHFRAWKWDPQWSEDWHVVFLGEKVNSRKSASALIPQLEEILNEPFYAQQFERVLSIVRDSEHTASIEAALEMFQLLMAQLLELQTPYKHFNLNPVKQGLCKWLGAWGGDMLLVNTTFLNHEHTFFKSYNVVPWNEIIRYE